DGTFHDASLAAGLGVNRKYLGFGAVFFDFDNDGWKDIFLANGHVYDRLEGRKLHLSYKQPSLLYRNSRNGRFEEISASSGPGLSAERVSRGCAVGDLDNDGELEIVVNNLDAAPSLLKGEGGGRNHSLIVKCVGTRSNRSAIGARVKVTAAGRNQIDEVMSGSSYYSQNDLRLHFGLGGSDSADRIEVSWPSGAKDSIGKVSAGQTVWIEEGKGVMKGVPFQSRGGK